MAVARQVATEHDGTCGEASMHIRHAPRCRPAGTPSLPRRTDYRRAHPAPATRLTGSVAESSALPARISMRWPA
jgi:hypothetical protein